MATQVQDTGIGTAHPLEPLTAEEVGRVSALLRSQRDLEASVRFVSIALHEPPKREVLDFSPYG